MMRKGLGAAVALGLSLLPAPSHGTLCTPSPLADGCGAYLNGTQGASSPSLSPALLSGLALSTAQELIAVGGRVDPVCAAVAGLFACTTATPACVEVEGENGTTNELRPQCRSLCESFVRECGDLIRAQGKEDMIPSCSSAPETLCFQADYDNAIPPDFECPPPLILNPSPGIPRDGCVGVCCLPCYPGPYFYREGALDKAEKVVYAFNVSSLISVIFVIVSYLGMKEKRTFPSHVITCIAFALFLFYFTLLFNLGDPRRVRCMDDVTPPVPGDNHNRLCQTQAVFVIYGILAAVMWYFLLVINVYMAVIFLSKRLRDYVYFFHPLCWGLPLVAVIVATAMEKTGYIFGIWCVTELGPFTRDVLMIPIAICIFPSVPLNFHVLFKIFKVARKRNASLPSILRLQMRFFVFVMVNLFIFLFYWIHYEVKLSHLRFDPSQPWLMEWFTCIVMGNGQNACVEVARDHVPELVQFIVSEILVNSIGIVLFFFFGLRQEVYIFWKSVLTGARRKIYDPFNTNTEVGSGNGAKSSQPNTLHSSPGDKEDEKEKEVEMEQK